MATLLMPQDHVLAVPTGLSLLIVVGARGALIASPGDLAQVVLPHVNRQSPNSAALPCGDYVGNRGECESARLALETTFMTLSGNVGSLMLHLDRHV
jgi:hypothetical protein